VPVEHQARPAARTLADAEHVGAAVLDLLPLHAQAHLEERLPHELAHGLLVTGEARCVDRAARPGDEPVADALVEAGTVTVTEPKEGVANVAVAPLNLIEERPSLRFAPLMVTVVPAGPNRGENPEMLA
jgi:hypothetical protein